jgi:hypothetical protein
VTFAKLYKTNNFVIPAKAGIQYYQVFPRFRVKPGMTNSGVVRRSQLVIKAGSIFLNTSGSMLKVPVYG